MRQFRYLKLSPFNQQTSELCLSCVFLLDVTGSLGLFYVFNVLEYKK